MDLIIVAALILFMYRYLPTISTAIKSRNKANGLGVVAFAVLFPPPILPDLKVRASRTVRSCVALNDRVYEKGIECGNLEPVNPTVDSG